METAFSDGLLLFRSRRSDTCIRKNIAATLKMSDSRIRLEFSDDLLLWIKIENTHIVIPAQAGIQKFEIAVNLKHFRQMKVWIPACAGMTA